MDETMLNGIYRGMFVDVEARRGLGTKDYEVLSELDGDCFEYIDHIGKVKTGILELYMLAFELSQQQLKEQNHEE